MSDIATDVTGRAAELRRAFDRAFAEPARRGDAAATTAFLALRVGTEPFAMRLADIAGLSVDKKITRVPGDDTRLIGLAAFRGAIVPVLSLTALLGQAGAQPSPASSPARWLAIAAARPVALAFESLVGQFDAAPDEIMAAPARGCIRDFVRTRSFAGPVLHVPSLLDSIGTEGSFGKEP